MPLLASWKLAMQAERKAPYTIDSYVRGVQYYLQWCSGAEPLERTTLQRWVTHLLDQGAEPATASIRQQAVRRFGAWLADPEVAEIDADPDDSGPDTTTNEVCGAFNLGVPPGDIPGRLGQNDGRENYWTAQRQSAWPIIEGDCG